MMREGGGMTLREPGFLKKSSSVFSGSMASPSPVSQSKQTV